MRVPYSRRMILGSKYLNVHLISFAKPYATPPADQDQIVGLLSGVLINIYNLVSLVKIAILLWATSGTISHLYRQ